VRYLILSDIHGNWEALDAVAAHARGAYDAVVCCGDLVGYCADPDPVIDWVRANVSVVVRGNHDKACAGLVADMEWFNPVARAAAEWTGRALAPGNLEYLRNLPKGPAEVDSFQILHGSPLDEDEYLTSVFEVTQIQNYLEKQVSFFGHSHLQGGFVCRWHGVQRIGCPWLYEETTLEIDPEAWYLINPGSVGQPRDGNPRAAYVLYHTEARIVEFRRVEYDVGEAQRKIRAAGLPEILALRLETGD
jgi:diadenosine tetraphosphatase ApaH/serine/threonine PP2A family protein phosphatase